MNRVMRFWVCVGAFAGASITALALPLVAGDESGVESIPIADEPKYLEALEMVPAPLRAQVTHTLERVPLQELAAWLQNQTGLSFLIDEVSLEEEGIPLDVPISESLENVPAYQFLDRLQQYGIGWFARDGIVIFYASKSSSRDLLTCHRYSIKDLLERGFQGDELFQAIECTVVPDSWMNVGGLGDMRIYGSVLVVRQSQPTHRKIAALLQALRHPARCTWIDENPLARELVAKLDQPASIRFTRTPISESLKILSDQHKLNLRVDHAAIEEEGIKLDEQLASLDIRERPVRKILEVLMASHNLCLQSREGELWITAFHQADEHLKTALFDVRDFCRETSGCRQLRDAIEATISPYEWHNAGGRGCIVFPRPGLMLVSQTEQVADDILAFLEDVRREIGNQNGPSPGLIIPQTRRFFSSDPVLGDYETRYYRLPTCLANDLKRLLPELVAKESWIKSNTAAAQGTIEICELVARTDLVAADAKATEPAANKESRSDEVPKGVSVLIIHQSNRIHDEIFSVIQSITQSNSAGSPVVPGMGVAPGLGIPQPPF
jgi:hypothetical protein